MATLDSNPENPASHEPARPADSGRSPLSSRKLIMALVLLIFVLGTPWWLTAIPEFGFTTPEPAFDIMLDSDFSTDSTLESTDSTFELTE